MGTDSRLLFISTTPRFFSIRTGTAKPFTRPANLATVSRSTVYPAIANRFSRFRVPPPYNPLIKRNSNRLKVYCVHFKGCNIYRNILTKGGEGLERTACVFLYYHNTPHEIFRHKVPSRNLSPRILWDAQSGDRVSIRVCSVM